METTTTTTSYQRLADITALSLERLSTGFLSLDDSFGGGIVPGQTILIAGTTGAGKSTLVLQMAKYWVRQNTRVLYVTGEENAAQFKTRASRLGIAEDERDLYITESTQVEHIVTALNELTPDIVIIDSVQMLYSSSLRSQPMTPSQITYGLLTLIHEAKQRGISIIFIGHATKSGYIAGMQKMQHMVDTVGFLSFDTVDGQVRQFEVSKNRFAPTKPAISLFMSSIGLIDAANVNLPNPGDKLITVTYKEIKQLIAGHRVFSQTVPKAIVALVTQSPQANYGSGVYLNRATINSLEKQAGFFGSWHGSTHRASLNWLMDELEKYNQTKQEGKLL